jgi:ribose 5-phosphate isomerase A
MNLKQQAATAALGLVEEGMVIGLGAGASIAFLVELLAPKVKMGLDVRFATASNGTQQLLAGFDIPVLPVPELSSIDLYFDGCDQVDHQLNALKSGAGIHTMEKLLASMAQTFILLGDESKLVDAFDQRYPVVMEVLPQAKAYVPVLLGQLFAGCRLVYRYSGPGSDYQLTSNGNYLLELWPHQWLPLAYMNETLKQVTGIVETSLFYGMAQGAIIAGKEGTRFIAAAGTA